jgi:hypothetical protein
VIKSVYIHIIQYARNQALKQQEPGTQLPKSACEHEDVTVLWDEGVQMDGEVLVNRAHIIIKHRKDVVCVFIDVAIPFDKNVI